MSATKKQRTLPQYELLYHPGIPGRGEYVRLTLEAAGVSYKDSAYDKTSMHYMKPCQPDFMADENGNPPAFAPPSLLVPGAGKDGKSLLIHQTSNILLYLGAHIGTAPDDEFDRLYVNQMTLTALDLSNEVHDTHHPIASAKYYEEQKEAALQKSADVREFRIPKYFSYFERILKANNKLGQGKYLVGDKLTYADTTLWQVVDGLHFAFPKEMQARKEDFPIIFDTFYPNVREESGIKEYLRSARRHKYSMGLFRDYPELDRP